MPLTTPPVIPLITDPSTFATRAQDWVVWQSNSLYPFLLEGASVIGLSTSTTSATSNTIGTGSKSFTVETGKGFTDGMSLSIARTSAPTNRMFVVVTSYSGTTLQVTSQAFEGSGTFTDWSISIAVNGVVTTAQIADSNVTLPKLENAAKTSKIQPITASVAANALTITLNPTTLDFRSNTLNSGTVTTVSNAAAVSLVISSGSSLGSINAVATRLAILAINNAGTIELAAVNLSGGTQLDETNLITTVAEGGAGAADSANVVYSTTARTNIAYRVVGFVDYTQATAGTYATAPSTIQGSGGNAFTGLSSIGYGQTWQLVTRAASTTYYNTTGKPILLNLYGSSASGTVNLTVGGVIVAQMVYGNTGGTLSAIIPNNVAYSYSGAVISAAELR